jgi:signal transduction histidine kinase/ActR/RegA family two-component response regulator
MLEKREESPDANPRPNFVDWRFDLALGLLEILNRPNRHIDEDVGAILSELQRALDFDSVAICLRKDEAFTIFEGKSQPEMFRGADRKLCEPSVAGGKCLCGHILHGEIDYTLPCFTSRGGFWSNNYASTVATVKGFTPFVTRGTCVREGYASIANLALRGENEILGILHLADHRPDRFTPEAIAWLESLASLVGISLTRQRAARELREAKERAEAANRAKSEFLANMSHEIRTPMNAIMGFTDLTLEGELNEEQRQYLTVVKERSVDLLRIIDDVLDLARIEADQVSLIDEPFRLRDAIGSAWASVRLRLEQKGLAVKSTIADDVPDDLRGDSLRLRQVLLNLISNAIKFTSQGTIELCVDRLPAGEGARCGLRFAVIDTGIGIPRSRQQAIFEPFVQADSSTVRIYGGTGLGLAICRRLVEKLGGEMSLTSEPGHGSTFIFTAFFRQIASTPKRSSGSLVALAPARSLRILVAEDDPTSRMLVAGIMRRDGHVVDEVGDGDSAVTAARANDYDVILMDVQMPGADGLAATRSIRAMATDPDPAVRRRSLVPVVAVTAHAMRGDAERCLDAGMDRHLAKPVQAGRLRACLAQLTGPGREQHHDQD